MKKTKTYRVNVGDLPLFVALGTTSDQSSSENLTGGGDEIPRVSLIFSG